MVDQFRTRLIFFLGNFIFDIGAVDLGFHGNVFTWCNKRGGRANIRERLDRTVASPEWVLLYDQTGILHLSSDSSYHIPIQLKLHLDHLPRPKPFRFFEVWSRDPLYAEVIGEAWERSDNISRAASIRYKIHSTTLALRKWNKEVFGLCNSRVKELEWKIQNLHGQCPTESVLS